MTTIIQALRWVRPRFVEPGVGKFIALIDAEKRVSVYAGNVEFHAHIPALAGLQVEGLLDRLYAAGTFSKEGQVLTWRSEGYSFETPVAHRKDIERFFSGQREAIEKCWVT